MTGTGTLCFRPDGLADMGTIPVDPGWIDYSGHMNIGYYLLAFELAAHRFMQPLDLSGDYRRRAGHALFAVETHINFLREAREGQTLVFAGQLLGFDAKRVRVYYRMFHEDGAEAAGNEVMYVHVGLSARRTAPFPEDRRAALAALWERQKDLPVPPNAGRGIAMPPPRERPAAQ